jgi:hypothetical protein
MMLYPTFEQQWQETVARLSKKDNRISKKDRPSGHLQADLSELWLKTWARFLRNMIVQRAFIQIVMDMSEAILMTI